ncbi:hypothetical protein ACTXT7_009281 [Hymenolepis weldensis]
MQTLNISAETVLTILQKAANYFDNAFQGHIQLYLIPTHLKYERGGNSEKSTCLSSLLGMTT